ncbi:transcription initiation factor iif subunit alpha-like isoform x2 [Plasmopara halstedii]|uniref:Transcription initiation factor IIF subunit alpha n=1 Tax=Plasmopara halstedii TaxID=4781 RepID=A0A0P1B5V8_PLAHL|nr:transcription initiation factor iif subunit alpha-like isoform x2 [Plasmopara halstedii]CEG50186.1 transcription initiation factor iif subunit alpha-like isoform x2 [Plasmopara halstedii]|eukprot:XP_024586555.1 transcription initiation factor iif subunit alpha-like isoform x2 [Plasmopara halstedii]
MSRPTAARNSTTSSGAEMETLVLRATPSIKRYNIARFDVPNPPRFSSCPQPVMMYREPERVDEEEKEDDAPVGFDPALRKRRRRRRKDNRTAGWVIEDSEGKNKFHGTFEGGQSSTYMLLVKNRHNDEFNVMPVEQWFRFKKPLNYRTLTLEEAEEMNNEKKRAVERWLMKHKLAGEDKNDTGGDTVSAPRVRTGALASSSSASLKAKSDGDDIFGSTSEARPRRVARPKTRAGEGATGEDGGDFDEKFDDDESDAEIHHDEPQGLESDSDEDEFEVDPEGTGKLTETGQAMKDLLKRAQSGEMLEVQKEKEDDDDDDEEDDNFTAKDMDVIKRDLGGNIIRDRSTAVGDNVPIEVKSGAGGVEGNAVDVNGKGKAITATGNSVTGKRKEDDSRSKEDTPTKAAKTTAASSQKLTEAGVQQELIRYGGRMRTRDLLRKLKKLIITDNDKALLKDILRTICDVEVDAIDGRLLVLKSQFR